MKANPRILLFTGHLIDAMDRSVQRFPLHMVDDARLLIKNSVEELLRHHEIDLAISSLGAGGDMLFASEVVRQKIPLIVYLPFEKDEFVRTSVEYAKSHEYDPSQTREEFERIFEAAIDVRVAGQSDSERLNPYSACNLAMLDFAFSKAKSERYISALALIKPGVEKVEGGTADFVAEMVRRKVPVQILWPPTGEITADMVQDLERFIPVFRHADDQAIMYQRKWRTRFKLSLIILGIIAFFDAFVTAPDHLFYGNGQVVRIFSLLVSVSGAFITLQMQLSDKGSLSLWTRSRAKAEQIRSEIWFYLFNYWTESNRFGVYSEAELEAYVKHIVPGAWGGQLLQLDQVIQLKAITQSLTVPQRIDLYLKYRIDDQLEYFAKKKNWYTDRIRKYKNVTLLFLTISILWGTFKLLAEFLPDLEFFMDVSPLGMMISFIALVSSYNEANNSKEMEYKYHQMKGGLLEIRKKHTRIKDYIELDEWINECESFLRTQNNEWSLKKEGA